MLQRLTDWMRSARESRTRLPGHMTFAATSVGRTFTRTSEILKRELWIWPIIAIVLLAIIGFGIKIAIERTMRHNLTSQLQTLLSVEESMLLTWLNVQEANAQSLANDQQVRATIAQMLATADPGAKSAKADATSPAAADSPNLAAMLAHELGPGMSSHHFVGYVVVDKRQEVIASSSPELVGSTIPQYEAFLSKTLGKGPRRLRRHFAAWPSSRTTWDGCKPAHPRCSPALRFGTRIFKW